jgi:hypothetical protein
MQAQVYLTNIYLNVSIVWQMRFARYVVYASALTLVVAAVGSVLYLAGHTDATVPLLSQLLGHAHAPAPHVLAEGPWP